jgi:hypothetical protein
MIPASMLSNTRRVRLRVETLADSGVQDHRSLRFVIDHLLRDDQIARVRARPAISPLRELGHGFLRAQEYLLCSTPAIRYDLEGPAARSVQRGAIVVEYHHLD